jgi:hypothetical protein
MAHFYFDFMDVDKQRLRNLLPSLHCQLSARSDSFCDILSRFYSANDRGAQKPSDRAMVNYPRPEEMPTPETQHPTYIISESYNKK